MRCSWFSQNFSESFFHDLLMTGEVVLPVEDVPEPFIDLEDVADIVFAALTEDGHVGRLYDVTGPRLLTFADALAEISLASGRPAEAGPRLARRVPGGHGRGRRAGGRRRPARVPVRRGARRPQREHAPAASASALGRDATDFREYAQRTAAAGAWAVAR